MIGNVLDGMAHGHGVGKERRDVFEYDAGLRVIRDIGDVSGVIDGSIILCFLLGCNGRHANGLGGKFGCIEWSHARGRLGGGIWKDGGVAVGCHLRARDLIVDGIDIGILDHGVKRLEDAVTQQRGIRTPSVRS